MHQLSLTDICQGLRDKQFSSVEICRHFIQRICELDARFNSFITTTAEQALANAAAADKMLAQDNPPPLCGVPMAHKDIFCTEGVLTTCGSKMLSNFVPPYNATVVEKFNQAGAVCLGKTNLDEFAMGSSTETSYYGCSKNPWDETRVPGGSSGGSAAAVAAQLVPAATATDTGGSIRQPAAFCGITGLRPTYGRVSRWGMVAFASSLDQGGILCHSAEDAALLLQTMAGYDNKDSTSINQPVPDYRAALPQKLDGIKVGIPKEYFSEALNSEIETRVRDALNILVDRGATLIDISLPHTHLAVPTYYIIAPAECSANLSRFDGVRYGHRCDNPENLQDLYMRSRSEGFGEEVQRRILVGTYALSAGYYDAYYLKAQQVRRLIKQDFVDAFQQVDIIAGPTTPTTAFGIGAKKNPVEIYMEDIFVVASNLAGLPGMSIPCGLVDGLPVGVQLIGNYFNEARMLNVAHQFQLASDFHLQSPDLDGGAA